MIISKPPHQYIASLLPPPSSSPPSSFIAQQRRTSLPSLCSDGRAETSALYASILSSIKQIAPTAHKGDDNGGVYLLKDPSNNPAAIFKPQDEESIPCETLASLGVFPVGKEIKEGLIYGEGYLKEIASYLLDKDHFHNVPPTALFHCTHSIFYKNKSLAKTGSLQKYVPHMCTSEDMGWKAFPTDEVHKIGILDCRILNTDRHMGNILVVQSGACYRLIPIDHGLSLPSSFSGGYFEWLSFPQSKQPFSEDVLAYIQRIDVDADIRMLKKHLPNLRVQCLKTLKVCTMFLQKCAKKGLTLYEIGCLMTRYNTLDAPCQLEKIVERVEERMRRSEQDGDHMASYYWVLLDQEISKYLKLNK